MNGDLLGPPNYAFMATTLAAFLGVVAAVVWLLRVLLRAASRQRSPERALGPERERERLLALEERVEAVADETARLQDAVQFQAELLATRDERGG